MKKKREKMKNKSIFMLYLLIILFSCKKSDNTPNEEEYLIFSTYLKKAKSLSKERGYQYLDSIQTHATNPIIEKYADISKYQFLGKKHDDEFYIQHIASLNQRKKTLAFRQADDYYKYRFCIAYYYLYANFDKNSYSNQKIVLNNLMEGLKYIEPYKEKL